MPLIPIKHLRRTGWACPAQWHGETADGLPVYVRYRWGTLTVSINHKAIFTARPGNALDGTMSEAELRLELRRHFELPEQIENLS